MLSCSIICSYFNHTRPSLFANWKTVSVETIETGLVRMASIVTMNLQKHEKYSDGKTGRAVTVIEQLLIESTKILP